MKAAVDYWSEHDPPRATKTLEGIDETLKLLASGPFDGREVELSDGTVARHWFVYPYRIVYERLDSELVVLRIFHARRDPDTL